MKGLPLTYQKDMQEDKEGAMEAFAALSLAIRAMTGMVADLVPDEPRMQAAAGEGYATATDLADWLVRTLKMPFREAHHVTGRIVAAASKAGVPLHLLPLQQMQAIEPAITAEVLEVLSVEASVKSRTSFGGTAPDNVLSRPRPGSSGWKKSENWAEPSNFAAISWSSSSRQNRPIFVWFSRIGDFVVKRNYSPRASGWAVILLSAAALALGGCGRKAGLDLPPNAAAQSSARR